jgi:S-adenosylmethionine hydrolase
MLVLYTDFGWQGPYVGQMKTALIRGAPGVAIIDLMHDAPVWDPQAAGRLLRALVARIPPRSVVLGVVDPGVGTPRRGLVARGGDRWFVGPDNGLFAEVLSDADARAWMLDLPPDASATFHGRDVFAPAAANLATGAMPRGVSPVDDWVGRGEAADCHRILYIDRYGNAMTGLSAAEFGDARAVRVGDLEIARQRTFADVRPGQPLSYVNSLGLVEIAVNQGSAADTLGIAPGDAVERVG